MMAVLKQIAMVTLLSLRSIPERLGSSLVIVIGIAGVAGVLLSVMAMAMGLQHTLANSGRDDRAIVMRNGSTTEMTSGIARGQVVTILQAPGIAISADGKPAGSEESVVSISLPNPVSRGEAGDTNIVLRGVSERMHALRPELKIQQGRMFAPGVRELIVGSAARKQFGGLNVGDKIKLRDSEWTVVGVFKTDGDAHESELLADVETVNSTFRRNGFQSVTVRLSSVGSFDAFKDALTTDPTLAVTVQRESQYYAEQSKQMTRLLYFITYVVGGIMAVGAVFGALNSMYSAVSTRSVEIATLRAIGFGPLPVVCSVFVEAVILAAMGGILGALIAWALFDGQVVSTVTGLTMMMAFQLIVTPQMVVTGILWAVTIGVLGGLFPAVRAARLPVAIALRAL